MLAKISTVVFYAAFAIWVFAGIHLALVLSAIAAVILAIVALI